MNLSLHLVELAMDSDPLVRSGALNKLREASYDYSQIRQSFVDQCQPDKFVIVDELLFQLELERIHNQILNWHQHSGNIRVGIDLLEHCIDPNTLPVESDAIYDELLMSIFQRFKAVHTDLDKCMILLESVRALNILPKQFQASDIHQLCLPALYDQALCVPLALCIVQALAQDLGLPLSMMQEESYPPMLGLFADRRTMSDDEPLVLIDLISAELLNPSQLIFDTIVSQEKTAVADWRALSNIETVNYLCQSMLIVIKASNTDMIETESQRQYARLMTVISALSHFVIQGDTDSADGFCA